MLGGGGALYGTASDGGIVGLGTVFKITFSPTLTITRLGTNAILTWSSNVAGFNLEVSTNLPGSWDPLTGQYAVTNPMAGRQNFYRLKSP